MERLGDFIKGRPVRRVPIGSTGSPQVKSGLAQGDRKAVRGKVMDKLGDVIRGRGLVKKVQRSMDMQVPEGLNSIQLEQWFLERLHKIIPPRDKSDRTSFRRIAIWLFAED